MSDNERYLKTKEPEPFPAWAKAEKYEYDLGMATTCENCEQPLIEGATVWRDTVPHMYQGKKLRTMRYCSERCVLGEDAP